MPLAATRGGPFGTGVFVFQCPPGSKSSARQGIAQQQMLISRRSCARAEFICYNIGMDKEKLMALLRNPQKFRKNAQQPAQQQTQQQPEKKQSDRLLVWAGGAVFVLVIITLLFIMTSSNRAENITAALDPSVLKGLVVDATFNPNTGQRVVQISEGQDRNVSVRELGTTLPVISRYNYRALTPRSYEIIGEAPYALSINVSSNIDDPDLLRYLFNQDTTAKAFSQRADVAPLLADPAALAKLAADQNKLNAFFSNETVQQVLASQELVSVIGGSRLFAYLLISPAVRHYRDNPAAAARLINASPALSALKKNPAVRKAVQENRYLKDIAATLLK